MSIQGACVWGTISNASAGMGRVVADGYGVSPWAIFVRPDSKIRKPEDLKDVPISVGMRAGSHFNVPYRLEKYLPLENIKTVNTGGFGARLQGAARQRSRSGEPVAAADRDGRAARPAQGDGGHVQDAVVGAANSPPEVVHGYMHALKRAEEALEADLREISPALEARGAGRIRKRACVGFQQIRPRRTLHQRAAAARGLRHGVRHGAAAGVSTTSSRRGARTNSPTRRSNKPIDLSTARPIFRPGRVSPSFGLRQ